MAPAQTTVGCPVPHSQELSSIGSVGDSYDIAMAEWQWTAMGFVDGSEKLGSWFRLPSRFSSIPDLSCRSLVTQDFLDYCCGVGGYVGLGGDGLTGDLDGDLA